MPDAERIGEQQFIFIFLAENVRTDGREKDVKNETTARNAKSGEHNTRKNVKYK